MTFSFGDCCEGVWLELHKIMGIHKYKVAEEERKQGSMMIRENVVVAENEEDYKTKVSAYLEEVIKAELKHPGIVSVGVSGGSMPSIVVPILLDIQGLDWKRIRLFMCDERNVPTDHPDSNYRQYVDLLPEELKANVVPIEIFDNTIKTAQCYDKKLRETLQPEMIGMRNPRFDLLLLGMGPDGHTCSLFPQSKIWKMIEVPHIVPVEDSPKPPAKRVSLSLGTINVAKNVAFLITGENKAEVMRSVLDGDPHFPAAMVKPFNEKLKYFLDKPAASKL